ncbi:hypothetical protein MUK70_12730 [Dyadobacter chenwenxiniae]|uniref:Uncharacterized protein n=1 Tax=Dyadobacter chenwenxiniae TaxID=2906456 RepID=A0A9X1PIH5_9BACT|nr:hypothetical protein [Dyadobacter chenwenxiniae]MCF0060108.1 hypothetical protein [Dyadobacter chenwenxiniae]UON85846.1 hypothetical protein MUK70_12730 [Dyadobacter chenwenxiniae]
MSHWERNYFGESEIRVDDVVFLENGMIVDCLKCPAYVHQYESPYSTATAIRRITIGVKYDRQIKLDVIRSHIFSTIQAAFDFFKIPLDDDLARRYIRHQVPDFDESPFCVPQGLYVVSGMSKYLRGQIITCTTYKPDESRPKLNVCFHQGYSHETNIERLRVIKDPENFDG